MRSMQCNVEFGYQLSIRSGTKEETSDMRVRGCLYSVAQWKRTRIRWRLVSVGQITNVAGVLWGRMTPGVIKDEK
jgi:hypothetical protein